MDDDQFGFEASKEPKVRTATDRMSDRGVPSRWDERKREMQKDPYEGHGATKDEIQECQEDRCGRK